MGDAGDVKDLICHQLEGEAEPLRSGARSWGEGQVADDQAGTQERAVLQKGGRRMTRDGWQ